MISEKTVSEILETARIEDVVKEHVNLKRRGSNLIGLCPFHNEKTPSFAVSPSKNIYKCFGCGEGGTPINFLMEYLQMSYPEALRHLAKQYNIEIEETGNSDEAQAQRQERESLFLLNDFACQYFQDQLWNTDRGKSVGLSYFKGRGFREQTIRAFQLGYAPGRGDSFLREALAKGYKQEQLEELGLTKKGRDFFRDRVIFTIHNLSGKVVGFAGRILHKDAKAPKYVNSAESPIYHKSKVLYGAHAARQAIRREDACLLVEGYTDVISLHQAGIENVVATSGTSLTEDQIQLIKRLTDNIILLFDGDAAGTRAALRGLDMVLEQGLNVRLAMLPAGEDPDSLVRDGGAKGFRSFLEAQAKDFILFKADLLLEEAGSDPTRKASAVRDLVSSIARVPDPIKRNLFIQECARIVELDEQLLVAETNRELSKLVRERRNRNQRSNREEDVQENAGAPTTATAGRAAPPQADEEPGDTFQERDIARVLICYGDRQIDQEEDSSVAEFILDNIVDVMQYFDHALYRKVVEASEALLEAGKTVKPLHFKSHADPEIARLAIDFLASPYEYSPKWEERWNVVLQSQRMPDENFHRDVMDSIMKFKLRKIRRAIFEHAERIKSLQADQAADLELLLRVYQQLKDREVELARALGMVVY